MANTANTPATNAPATSAINIAVKPAKSKAPARHAPNKAGGTNAAKQPQATALYNGGKPFQGKCPAALVQIIADKQAAVKSPRAALRYVAAHVGQQATQSQFIAAAQAAAQPALGRPNAPATALRQWQKGRGLPIT